MTALENYAKLAVEIGLNVQKSDGIIINANIEDKEFVRLVVDQCYKQGADFVEVNWMDQVLSRMKYENSPLEYFKEVPDWLFEKSKYFYDKRCKFLFIDSSDPNLLEGIDPEKIKESTLSYSKKMKPLQKYTMNDIVSWSIIATPELAWAKMVFPQAKSDEEAMELLLDAILQVTRMKEDNPIQAWQDHITNLQNKAKMLNDYAFESLHYCCENGTDLMVGLPEGHIWVSATSTNEKGETFLPNIPTEEVFTMPHMDKVNGKLVSTMPLSYQGHIIDHFSFTFKDGAVVDFQAEKGEEVLRDMLNQDENAKKLGEVALVPYDSPISNANILFYNTLFDENASCHFAFGASYPTCLEGGSSLSEKELMERGGNDSLIHVDFMVGHEKLSIDGITKEGEVIPVFRNGNFVI